MGARSSNKKAVDITNKIRARVGKGPLKVGPTAMLNNALRHCVRMSKTGMRHQNLRAATEDVGSGLLINRENVAYYSGIYGDRSKQLMRQWKNSRGHYKNIVGADKGDYVVVGVFTDRYGRTWGTQTFGKKAKSSNRRGRRRFRWRYY